MINMIDIHCHLDWIDNPELVIAEARDKGMTAIVTSVADPAEMGRVLELRRLNQDFLYVALGFHPHGLKEYDDAVIDAYMKDIESVRLDIVAIGEIGLEYTPITTQEEKDRQKHVFERFILFANSINLPIIVHIRDAYEDAIEVMAKTKPRGVILHCFSGSETILKYAVEHGYYISFATNICYTKKHPRLASQVPLDKLLLETDSPWNDPDALSFEERQKLGNRPWKIIKSAEVIAGLHGKKYGEILEITTNNAKRVFGI